MNAPDPLELRAWELERESRTNPALLDARELIDLMEHPVWSVRMHVCRMLPRISWSVEDYPKVVGFAFREAESQNAFIRAWALDALASLACADSSMRQRVVGLLERGLADKPAVRVRCRESLKRLAG